MMQRFPSTLLIILFFVLAKTGSTQVPLFHNIEIKHHGNKMQLQSIILDSEGTLLCGTNQGVMHYDGTNFSPAFEHDSSSAQEVQSLYKDHKGRIWVGYKNGKIGSISSGKFSWLSADEEDSPVPVSDFAEDTSGGLFFSTEGEGVSYYKDGKFTSIKSENGLSDDYCYKIVSLENGMICVATDHGINFIRFENGNFTIDQLSAENGLPDNIVRNITVDKNQQLWISLQDKGLCRVDPVTKKITIPEGLGQWKYGQVNTILPLEEEVWLGTENFGILRLEKNGSCYPLRQESSGLKQTSIKMLLSDKERHVWAASGNQLLLSNGEAWNKLPDLPKQTFGFIHCILADKNGSIWFSPDQQLYCAKKQNDGTYSYTKYIITSPGKLIDIVTLCEDEIGNIWIGTLGEGVFILNTKNGKIQHPVNYHELQKGNILCIEEHDNKIRIGGFGGTQSYTYKYNIETGQYDVRVDPHDALHSLYNNYIYAILTDHKGRTWLGTDEKGLGLLENDKLTYYTKTDGLSSNTIVSIKEDKEGRIWIATQGGGISVYDGNKFENISLAEGLSDHSPSSIIIDKYERVLAVHSNGVDIFDPKSRTFQYYSSESNLGDLNPDLNSVSAGPDGRIWIGTEKGIYVYKPSNTGLWVQPSVSIQNILLFLERIPSDNNRKFEYDQNNISIEFNAAWYTDPNRITYSYQLDGYSSKWQTTKDHAVSYPRLPPGTYVFRVRASLNSHYESASEASYNFIIKSPFWQTSWFRILLSVCILAILILIVRRREYRLRKEEKQEKEKIEFRFETLRSQVNPHFLFNSFNTLITVIEKEPGLAVEYVEHLAEFFRNIVGYRDIEMISLKEEITLLENYMFIQTKRYGKNLLLQIDIDPKTQETYFIPPLTLQLLAENALKHNAISHESTLTIDLFIRENYLMVRNNINPKYSKEKSTGMGLQNIMNRYKLLTSDPVEIKEDDSYFTVSLPLLHNNET